jgi:two-component system, NtrC family, response regulator AtoC
VSRYCICPSYCSIPSKLQNIIRPMPGSFVETARLLVVSRDLSLLHPLWSLGESKSWRLETASSCWEAMERVDSEIGPHLLLLDVPRGDEDGLHILRWLRRVHPDLPVIVTCHADDPNQPKEALRIGAEEVVVRPFVDDRLEAAISKHLYSAREERERPVASGDIETLDEDGFFLSASPVMQKLRAQAELLAQADVPVLILGEPGSGKATIARLIHKLSIHSGFRFLRVHCGKVPLELLEAELFGGTSDSPNGSDQDGGVGALAMGEKGTLLLEEITEMPLPLQARLVHALQDHQLASPGKDRGAGVDVQILVSSSAKLARALAENRLREDLYYRLGAFTVHVPPLRQRKVEIKLLLQYAMHRFARHYGLEPRGFTPQVLDACSNHSWPGNLQELENFVKCYLITGDQHLAVSWLEMAVSGTPGSAESPSSPRDFHGSESDSVPRSLKSLIQSLKSETEKNAIAAALEKTRWNRKAAAKLLQVSYRSMLYKIDQYDINPSKHGTSSFLGLGVLGHGNGNQLSSGMGVPMSSRNSHDKKN